MQRMLHDRYRHTECLLDQMRLEDFVRCPGGEQCVVAEQGEPISKNCGVVKIVQGHHDHHLSFDCHTLHQAQHLELVLEVESRRRLVEKQDGSLLGQGAREDHPSPLASREFRHRAFAQVPQTGCVQCFGNAPMVLRRHRQPPAAVGSSAKGNDVDHAKLGVTVFVLGHQRNVACEIALRATADVFVIQQYRSAIRLQLMTESPQQRRFAGPVGS